MFWPPAQRRRLALVAVLVSTLLAASAPARGQSASCQIRGEVRDLNDTPVADVPVVLSGSATATTTTDAAGRYVFTGLAAGGTYTVTPTRPAFTFAPASQAFPALARDEVAAVFVVTRGVFTRYFAEGATGPFFTTEIALLNVTGAPAETVVTFQTPAGTSVAVPLTLGGLARQTVNPATTPGLDDTALATVIASTQPLVADRTMRWDRRGYGSHTETSVAAPRTQWYLAEGATLGAFQCFYLLQNPGAAAATVEVTYLRPAPAPPLVKTYAVPGGSRFNIWVNLEQFQTPSGPQALLAAAEFAAAIRSDVPVIVERAMYLARSGRPFDAGHASAASAELSTTWFLAEGATGPFFDCFVLIANPQAEAAEVAVTYLLPASTFVKRYTVPAHSRFNIWVDLDDPRLADTAVSLAVASTNGVPILVERAMWWPGGGDTWGEGHASRGATETGETWAVADGQVGGPLALETYVLVANTSPFPAQVEVTVVFEDGPPVAHTYRVDATSRFTLPMGLFFPETGGTRFGVVVESRPTADGTAQIVVERASYNNATIDGQAVVWAAGANAFGTLLRAGDVGDGPKAPADLLPLAWQTVLHLPPVSVTADAGHAARAEVGPAGGTVVATGADGTTYTLTVPRGALGAPTPITLTPVTALTGLPVPVALVAAVQGAPDGLRFALPARLVITLPQPLVGDVLGLRLPDSGAGFDLVPVPRHGATLTLPVTHFSTIAIPRSTPALLALLAGTGAFAQVSHLILTATTSWSPTDAQPVLDFMVRWYDTEIDPHLITAMNAAATDEVRLAWLAEFYRWEDRRAIVEALLGHLVVDGGRIRGRLTARATSGRQGAVAVLGEAYAAWNTQCQQFAGAVPDRLRLAGRAAGFAVLTEYYLDWLEWFQTDPVEVDPATPPNRETWGLGRSQIPATFCVKETLTVATPALQPGGSGILRVTAGVVFGAEPRAVGEFMQIDFQPAPPTYTGHRREPTSATGEVTFPVTADVAGTVVYRVCADISPAYGDAFAVTALFRPEGYNCRSSVTGVVVSPAQTTIAPGASRQFSVVVEGTPNQAVTWTVDGGGTLSQTGRFTSNGTEGTFFVRATSVEDPNAVGVAQITVGSTPPPPPSGYPCVGATCTFSGTWTYCELYPDGVRWICQDRTWMLGNPEVRVDPLPISQGLPARIQVTFTCLRTGARSGLHGTVDPLGAFTATHIVTGNCVVGTATGTVSQGSVSFTLPDASAPDRRVYSFTSQ